MTELTALDQAYIAMDTNLDDEAARLRFYERLADGELFLMLKTSEPADSETVTPEVFDLGAARYVLVFDREERLAAFAGQVTPYVALSGRSIAAMLAGQDIGLGLNLDVGASSLLLPAEAILWLHNTLGNAPDETHARIAQVRPPKGLPEQLVTAIDTKLASAMGLATSAYLAGVTYEDETKGHLLGFVGALPQAQDALAQASAEALTFSGIEAGALDIAFFNGSDPVVEKLDLVGLRFDLPQMQQTVTKPVAAPGSDPLKPPKLK